MGADEAKYFDKIKQIEKEFYDALKGIDTSFPKPLNSKEERKKFFTKIREGEMYNPQFIYEKKTYEQEVIKRLKNIKIDTENDMHGFKKLYKEKIRYKINEILCHKNWGDPISTKYAILYRGKPSKTLLEKAEKYCKNFKREKVKFKRVTPIRVGKELKEEVKRLFGENITVEFVPLTNKVNINTHKRLIKINPEQRFTTLDIKRLKVHEIGTHYLRSYNGRKLGLEILSRGTANYTGTEEGLAAYMEDIKGVLSKAQMYIYAGRVIATYYTTKKSFYELYRILKKFKFKDQDAFTLAFRAKRNISDTSQKGGYTRDYVYFKGYYEIKRYSKKHDIKDLFIGKIKLKETKLLGEFIKKNKNKLKTILD